MKYFVAGGAGFIGSNYVHYLFGRGDDIQVTNYDALTYAGNLLNLRSIEEDRGYTFIKGDICDRDLLDSAIRRFSPDVVINFAAESHVDRSILSPGVFIRSNILGVQHLLEICLENEIPRYVQISTDEVYGSLGIEGSFTEKSPLDPHSPYAASKASADLLTKAFHDTYGLPTIITRSSNNYGPYQFPEKLIPLTILNCCQRKKIPVYGDGLNVRDWIHVGDHCSAIDTAVRKGRTGEIYNIGGGNERTNISVVLQVVGILSEQIPGIDITDPVMFVEDRRGHDRRYAIDSSKIRHDLGWRPERSFDTGLEETVRWYLGNQPWVASVLNEDYITYYQKNYGNRRTLSGG
jgi:dTDP-glucose 4,6-dehydratase